MSGAEQRCPQCGYLFSLSEGRRDADWRAYVALWATLPEPVKRPMGEYLELFRPASRHLGPGRLLRLTEQLAPLIRAAEIKRHSTRYTVPADLWAQAMQYLVDTPPKSLTLPLKSHAYLLEMLANRAEKMAARAEAEHIKQARRPRALNAADGGPSGGPKPIAQVLDKAARTERLHGAMRAAGLRPKGDAS